MANKSFGEWVMEENNLAKKQAQELEFNIQLEERVREEKFGEKLPKRFEKSLSINYEVAVLACVYCRHPIIHNEGVVNHVINEDTGEIQGIIALTKDLVNI